MRKKIAGKLNTPPAQADFDVIPLGSLCRKVGGIFYRLHSTNPETGEPWPPLHFSRRGNSRFDPKSGVGTLCIAKTLPGALMELFDDHWGPVGSLGRSVTELTLAETWVSLVSLPRITLFDATGPNLSKLGTDGQLLTGKYSTTRKWAMSLMRHPDQIEGILYRSRHDPDRLNAALFERGLFPPVGCDPALTAEAVGSWRRKAGHGSMLIYGPAIRLRNHPELNEALMELQVARLP
jgi:hypothetical protein